MRNKLNGKKNHINSSIQDITAWKCMYLDHAHGGWENARAQTVLEIRAKYNLNQFFRSTTSGPTIWLVNKLSWLELGAPEGQNPTIRYLGQSSQWHHDDYCICMIQSQLKGSRFHHTSTKMVKFWCVTWSGLTNFKPLCQVKGDSNRLFGLKVMGILQFSKWMARV